MNSSKGSFRKKAVFLLGIFQVCFSLAAFSHAQNQSTNDPRHQYFNEVINGVRLYYHIFTADPQKPYVFFLHGGPGGNCRLALPAARVATIAVCALRAAFRSGKLTLAGESYGHRYLRPASIPSLRRGGLEVDVRGNRGSHQRV